MKCHKYDFYRNRALIEIKPAQSGSRLGFALKVKRKSLNHPTILFSGGYARAEWGSMMGGLSRCALFDENGNLYKDDFIIAGGRPVYIFPLTAKTEWVQGGDTLSLVVRVYDPSKNRTVHLQTIPNIPRGFVGTFGYPKEPKPSFDWEATIQVIAEGLERQEVQRFYLALQTVITRLDPNTPLDNTPFWFELKAMREPKRRQGRHRP